ncbi:hypothetical protein IV203_025550 [Nitzschia inconspicua]|uniref:Uncharacterized protein n=1 Tax=Nitzschia inconspicua TaxID=303405 RepID=A0A9K3LHQ7_9STRA|nr:hypothetical protein IV203_025550 [Nitzschia inconspicua]
MTDNIKFHGPLMKELQRCAAFRAYEHIMSSGTTVGGSDLEEAHLNLYFSDVDEDHVGFAEQLVKGTGMFNALYNEINGELVMKELYHCLPGKKNYSNASNTQGAINMAVMSSKNLSNRVKLKKRVIVTMAKETLKFGKKALAIVKRSDYYRTYMATSSFPSGKNYEDYCHFVREEMFKAREDLAKLDKLNPEEAERVINREAEAETEGEGAYDVDDSAEAHINEEEEKMPNNFTFKGYIAFVLWGPIPPPEYAGNDDFMATAYAAKYRKTLKADGRAAARVSEEREAAKERSQDPMKSQRLGVLAYLTYNYMSRGMSPVLLGQLSSLFLNAMSKCSTSLDLNCCMDIFRTTISPFECDTLSTMLGTTSWFCSFIMSPPIPIPDVS